MAKFTQLRVWQQARELLQMISEVTADMRAEGDLKSQMRRAAISIVSNIAEGAEKSDREFCRFLGMAMGSNAEIEAQIIIAGDIGNVDLKIVAEVLEKTDHIGKMMRKLVQYMKPSG